MAVAALVAFMVASLWSPSTTPTPDASATEPAQVPRASTPVSTELPDAVRIDVPPAPRGSARLHDVAGSPRPAPVRVRIPAVGVDAPVVGVGVRDAALDVPDDSRTVAWYRYGPAPGDGGSAVLAAHVATAHEGDGVFAAISTLWPGDLVDVTMEDGTTRLFVVEVVERHAKAALPVGDLFARDGDPRLVLITCGGRFDRALRTYEDNVVVRATPMP